MTKPGKLTPKQERFAQVYVETSNASEAYRQVCDVAEGTKPECVWASASRVMADVKVSLRIIELQAMARESHNITVKSISEMYLAAYQMGEKTENSSGMSTAATGQAKLHGLVTDKSVIKSEVKITTPESVSEDISEMFGDK